MELWHLGLCVLCIAIGGLVVSITDIMKLNDELKSAYHDGYHNGYQKGWKAMAEKIGLEEDEDD